MQNIPDSLVPFFSSLTLMITILNFLLHIIFASAVAKDAGQMNKIHRTPYLVSGITWAFATLVGGVLIAICYWLIHYSTLARKFD